MESVQGGLTGGTVQHPTVLNVREVLAVCPQLSMAVNVTVMLKPHPTGRTGGPLLYLPTPTKRKTTKISFNKSITSAHTPCKIKSIAQAGKLPKRRHNTTNV